jgi:hypothetical protein
MPWDEGPNAGFTPDGVVPWLPVGDRRGLSVATQLHDRSSTLQLARSLVDLRRRAVGPGAEYEQLPSEGYQWLYRTGRLVVAANLSDAPALVDGPDRVPVLSTAPRGDGRPHAGRRVPLAPWEALVWEMPA